MTPAPQVGEVWFVDFAYDEKPRWCLVVATARDARLALASVVKITTEFADTPYELRLPRVPWLREQSYVNAQSVQPVALVECVRKAPGKFDLAVLNDVRRVLRLWLNL